MSSAVRLRRGGPGRDELVSCPQCLEQKRCFILGGGGSTKHRGRYTVSLYRGFNRPYNISYRGLKLSSVSKGLPRIYLRDAADLPQVVRFGI
jgi:hypothetical protein